MTEYGQPDPHRTNRPIPPHLRDDDVVGNSPLNPNNPSSQGYKPPKKTRLRTVLIASGTGLLGLVIGLAAGGGGTASSTPSATKTVAGATVTVTPPPVVKTVTRPGPTVKVTETQAPPEAAGSIDEGTWEVGVDVAPGRYKTTAAVDPDSMCYWKITKTGKPNDIVDNDIVTGGKPTVTIRKGQDFTTQDCGTWTKVG